MPNREKAPFFTWIDKTYTNKSEVSERLVLEMKVMANFGAKPEELSDLFNVPVEWVCEFLDAPLPKNLSN